MKTFNKSIKIEVRVDMIAKKLLNSMKEDNPHRELVTEAIIGSALNTDTVHFLYNALNGYTGEVNFEEGQLVSTEVQVYDYGMEPIEGEARKQQYRPIGDAKIVEIDEYRRDEKVKIEFVSVNYQNRKSLTTQWVNHTKLAEATEGYEHPTAESLKA